MVNTNRKGRGVLSSQQTQSLIDSIRKTQTENQGLNKKSVVKKAFEISFGPNSADWPIQPHSSTIARYWRHTFPSEQVVNIGKKKHRSAQPLIDDLRKSQAPEGYRKIVCICPECNTLIKIETTKL